MDNAEKYEWITSISESQLMNWNSQRRISEKYHRLNGLTKMLISSMNQLECSVLERVFSKV